MVIKASSSKKRDRDDSSDGSKSTDTGDEVLCNAVSLGKMSRAELIAMLRKLKITPDATAKKKELVSAILKIHKKGIDKKNEVTPRNPDIEIWKDQIKTYAGELIFPEKFDWVSPRILLCPPLWLVVFWCQPPNESEVYENLGGTGVLIRNLKDRWQNLTGAPQEQLTFFASHFQNLYQSITSLHLRVSDTMDSQLVIETWFQRNWQMQVSPVLTAFRMLQAGQVRAAGQSDLAGKMEAKALMPLENFSADMAYMVQRAIEKGVTLQSRPGGVTLQSKPGGGNSGRGGRAGRGGRTWKCYKCKKILPIGAGKTQKQSLEEHRKTCQ